MPWYTLYSQTLTSDAVGYVTRTVRQTVAVAGYDAGAPTTGTKLRVSIQGSSAAGSSWTSVYIGHAAASGDAYDFNGTQAQVLFSGSASGSVSAGATVVSDDVTYAFDKTKRLVISVYVSSGGQLRGLNTATNFAAYFQNGDSAATTDVTGYTATLNVVGFTKVEVFAPDGVVAAAGSYALTGTAAGFVATGTGILNAAAGSYAITGAAAGLGPGYQLTGSAATFVTATSGTTILTAGAGSYGLTGTAAGLAYSATLTAGAGSYALTGTVAGLGLGYKLTGSDASFVIGVAGATTFPASAGSYTLTGSPVTFLGAEPITPPTSYTGGASRGRMIRKRRKREEEEEPIPVIGSTPVAAPPPPPSIPPQPGLMAGVRASPRTVLRSPPDEDEDEIALLLELLS